MILMFLEKTRDILQPFPFDVTLRVLVMCFVVILIFLNVYKTTLTFSPLFKQQEVLKGFYS